jgi:N utilization substance protein B
MTTRRDIRTLALQTLYQLDARPGVAMDDIRASAMDAPVDAAARDEAVALALAAWESRQKADDLAAELAPTWPPSRQPAIDRAVIRLAFYEMSSGSTPAKVAINEAVDLAKAFSTERSGAFVNGVLDKMMRRLEGKPHVDSPLTGPADAWLDDALQPPTDESHAEE